MSKEEMDAAKKKVISKGENQAWWKFSAKLRMAKELKIMRK
jgi:hypothetical protein